MYDEGDRNSGGVVKWQHLLLQKTQREQAEKEKEVAEEPLPSRRVQCCFLDTINYLSCSFICNDRPSASVCLDSVTLVTNTARGTPGQDCKAKESLSDQRVSATKIPIPRMKQESESQGVRKGTCIRVTGL